MQEPIYFSIIEFYEGKGSGIEHSIILLNLAERELSYQTFKYNPKQGANVVQMHETKEFKGKMYSFDTSYPAYLVASSKTDFKPELIKAEKFGYELIFSYGIRLSDSQYEELLPLCNALDFEPYQQRKMIMGEEGYIGYRDEVDVYFRAITDSHIPMIELPMEYFYDEAHIWPSEKLYRHIINNIFEKEKKLKGHYTVYGAH